MDDDRVLSERVLPRREKRVRVTFTHEDFNVMMCALGGLADEIRDYQGAADPYLGDISRVEEKIQAARKRLR